MRMILFEPDIAGNVGAVIRICACLGANLEIIEPCGFPLKSADLRRAAMDYGGAQSIMRHSSWDAFMAAHKTRGGRLLLMTTKGAKAHSAIAYRPDDAILIGRESVGAPEALHEAADERLVIPMAAGARSLNMAVSAGIVLAEANRQLAD